MKCQKCKSDNPEGAGFCNTCGAKLEQSSLDHNVEGDPYIGKTLGHGFCVISKLGEGGMGAVYLGEQTSIKRPVALKVLSGSLTHDPALKDRFRNEALLASRLNHPNTVTIYDFGISEEGSLFIAMELVDGESLDDVLTETGEMEWSRSCRILSQICESLQDAHEKKIVHRDLKPENVMLTRQGSYSDVVKVLDFGIAKILADDTRGVRKNLTAPNETFGTPEYMSPEQVSARALDNRTDIYSLGVIGYRMLTGRLPFEGTVPVAVLAKHLAELPPPFVEVNPALELPDGLEELILAMMSKDPEDRPQSMRDVGSSLVAFIENAYGRISQVVDLPPQSIDLSDSKVQAELSSSKATVVEVPVEALVDASVGSGRQKISLPDHSSEVREDLQPGQAMASIPVDLDFGEEPSGASPPSDLPGAEISGNVVLEGASAEGSAEPVHLLTQALQQRGQKENTLDRLITKMKKMKDFPAVSQHLSELNTKVGNENTSASQLSNVILKDYALTTKLLKLINSPYFGQVRGRINTVSRAVVLMGFENVRQAALSLMLFEHLQDQNSKSAGLLKESAIESMMSGLIAKTLSKEVKGAKPESAFVCAMYYNLGKHVTLYYFPEEMDRIVGLMERKGYSEEAASRRVLGVSYENLAIELGKRWDFPVDIRSAMERLPPGPIEAPKDDTARMRCLVSYSNELTDVYSISDSGRRSAELSKLMSRYEDTVKKGEDDVLELLDHTVDQLEEYAQIMNVRPEDSPLIRRIMRLTGRIDEETVQAVAELVKKKAVEKKKKEPFAGRPQVGDSLGLDDSVLEKVEILSSGARDVERLIKGRYDLNELMITVIETMYRGLGLSRVIFMLNDVRANTMQARSGFGKDVEEKLSSFNFKLERTGDIFNYAMSNGRDVAMLDRANVKYKGKIPRWYRELINAPMFLLYPVRIKHFPAALFYGDYAESGVMLDKSVVKEMETLRGHAAKAISESSVFKGGR